MSALRFFCPPPYRIGLECRLLIGGVCLTVGGTFLCTTIARVGATTSVLEYMIIESSEVVTSINVTEVVTDAAKNATLG